MNKFARLMLVLVVFLASTGLDTAFAGQGLPVGDDAPPPPRLPDSPYSLYLPVVDAQVTYTVSGRVTDAAGQPLSGVTVTGDNGETTVTNDNGRYSLRVDPGQTSLAPAKNGFMFSPSMVELNVNANLTGQDFSAVLDCSETISNSGFESTAWWTLVSGGYTPAYTNAIAHNGLRSMRMGILNAGENRMAESRIRSQPIAIPTGATNATLRMWLYPISTEAPAIPQDKAAQVEAARSGDGVSAPAFGDATLLYDAQYVRVLDTSDNLLGTLMYIRSSNSAWGFHEFNLLPFAGRTVKLEIGVYNDGSDGVTALFADDISFQVCANVPPPPPPPVPDACANQAANSGFEYNGSWNMPYTTYPAGYSYDFAYTGVRSMRTGIALSSYANVESYSDAWQTVYIPAGATNARLKMRLYPRSEEVYPTTPENAETPGPTELPASAPKEGLRWDDQALGPDATDAQYVLLLNPNTGVVIRTLEWWSPRSSASGWLYREYDLSAFAGQYVRIQFGTYNNGYGGRSVMYVDDVQVQVCSAPPPPPVCAERISNGGFENNAAWYIPYTEFSAGYSTWLKRSGARSMRTGIVYAYHNRYSYSDVRQTVTIPPGVGNATLYFSAYSMSGEAGTSLAMSERPTAGDLGAEAMSGDVQYLLVLDRYGNWIDTLLWRRSNESYWRNFSFNLNRYIGSTIMLQWGTFNNGYSGVTSMYVDDVSLQVCP